MSDDLNPHNWPSDLIFKELSELRIDLTSKIDKLSQVILGVKDSDERGLVGDVKTLYDSRNKCLEDIAAIHTRCDMEHGKDPGGKNGDNTLARISEKVGIKWLVLIATAGAFFGGMVAALGDHYNWW